MNKIEINANKLGIVTEAGVTRNIPIKSKKDVQTNM